MAQFITAKDVTVKFDEILLGCAQSASLTITREMIPVTCQASNGFSQQTPGNESWSGSIGAVLRLFETAEEATNVSLKKVIDLLQAGTEVDIEYSFGGLRYAAKAYLSEVAVTSPESGNVTWTANMVGNSRITLVTPELI